MGSIDSATRPDLLEIIEDRAGNKASIITAQLPIERWHAWIDDPTIADSIRQAKRKATPTQPAE